MSWMRRPAGAGAADSASERTRQPSDDRRRPSLTRQAGALASGSLVAQAAALVLLMALTRLVPKTELGSYQQLTLLYGIVSPLLLAGIPSAMLYFIPRSDDPEQLVGEAYLLLGSIGLLSSIVVAVERGPISQALGNPELSGALLVYSPHLFFAFVAGVTPMTLVAVHRAGLAAALNAVAGGLIAIGVLSAALVRADASYMAAGLVAGQAGAALVGVLAVHRSVGISLARGRVRHGAAALLRYGGPLALTGLAAMLAFQFDRLVVSREFTPARFAVYVVGAVELPIALVVQQAFNAVMVPALTRHYAAGDLAGMAMLWRRAIRRTSLIVFPLFVFFTITASATVRVLFGGSYSESAEVFRIYLLLVLIRVAPFGLITQAIGRPRINLTASFVLLALNAALVLALVGPLDLKGAALGTVLATLGTAIYYLSRIRGVLKLSLRELFPGGTLGVNLTLSALAGLPAALLAVAGFDGLLQLAVAALLYGPCYVGLLALTRRLDAQEIEWARRALAVVAALPRRRLRPRATDGSG